MKKLTKFSLLGLALSLCVGSAVVTTTNKEYVATVADAANPTMVFETDATNEDPKVYSQSGSDLSYLPFSSMTTDTTPDNFDVLTGTTFTVREKTGNKLYNYIYQSFFIYSFVPAKTRYHYELSLQLSLTKNASSGAAAARAELFKLGVGNDPSNHLLPSLINNRFDTTQTESATGSVINNCTTSNNSVGMMISGYNRTVNTTLNLTYNGDNYVDSEQVVRYQLGLFVGCNYASSYNHQTEAVISVTSKTVTSYPLTATVTSGGNVTSYLTLDEAVEAAPAGSTVNVISDCNWTTEQNESNYLAKNLTINLNGHTVSMAEYNDGIGVKNNSTITINGGGGTLRNNANDNQYAQPLLLVKAGSTMNVSNVTLSKPNGSHGVAEVYGAFTADSTVTISTNSAYINGCGVLVYGTSATATLTGTSVSTRQSAILVQQVGTFKSNGATITSTNYYAIETDNCVSYSNSVYVYGATTLSYGGSATAHIYLSSTGNNDKVYATANGKTFLTKAVTVRLSSNVAEGTTVVSSDKNEKISITNTPASGYEYGRRGELKDIVYRKKTYYIYFNNNGGTGSMSTLSRQHGESYTLPECTMTAPAGKKFLEWNTNADGTGISRNPGDSIAATASIYYYAIWVDTAQTKISNQASRTDLYYQYHWYDNGTFSYSNVAMRFGALMSKALWDELATETTIQGYGVLVSQENYIGGDPIKDVYADDPTDPRLEDFYMPKAQKAAPSLATDTQRGDLVGQYYIWNVFYNISSLDLTKTYVAAAYIKTSAGVVFFDEIRTSAAKNAYDMIQAGADVGTSNGSLKNLADMYDPD